MSPAKVAQADFRQELNAVLKIMYDHGDALSIYEAVHEKGLQMSSDIVWAIARTFEKDGYAEFVHDYSQLPIGRISGAGRIFHEAGGYRDTRDRADRLIGWFKNHPLFAWIILGFIGLGAVNLVLDIIKSIRELFTTP